jgi:cyclic-di-AMP phosphodiesterase PgpH
LAREAGLPEPIIDIIKEHHGTTLVYCFYRKQIEKMGNDKSKVDEKEFRYAGPKPRTKESGIIMIADSLEAASRCLERVNAETLTALIDRIVWEKIDDRQFDHCLLTFEELSIVKQILVKTLLAAGHSRIKYPVPERKAPERKGFIDTVEEIA